MEDLLASIRKAINEDIGPESGSASKPAGARAAATEPVAAKPEDQSAAASEIQQLREKITRSRNADPTPPREPSQRAATLAAALRNQTPRRAWRETEPASPQAKPQPKPAQPALAPRLRTTILDAEPAARSQPPVAQPGRPASRYSVDKPIAPWSLDEVPRDGGKADDTGMLSGGPAQAVQSSFGRLAESVLARAMGEQSIEEMTRELLKVMLKQWLDVNLPPLVERLVREEIERVARTGR